MWDLFALLRCGKSLNQCMMLAMAEHVVSEAFQGLTDEQEIELLGRRLTDRDRKFAMGILSGKSAAMAYRDAGYKSQHSDVMGSRKLSSGGIAQYLRACARLGGYSDEHVIKA